MSQALATDTDLDTIDSPGYHRIVDCGDPPGTPLGILTAARSEGGGLVITEVDINNEVTRVWVREASGAETRQVV